MRGRLIITLLLAWGCEDNAASTEAPLIIDAAPPGAEAALPPLRFDAGPRPDAAPDMAIDAMLPDAAIDAVVDAALNPARPFIQEGLDWLAVSEPHFALRSFEAALEIAPEDPNALFGAALAGAFDGIELTVMLFSVITGQMKITRTEALVDSLHGEFMGLRGELMLALERADRVDPAGLDLELEAAYLHLGLAPSLILRGALDEGDLRLFQASVSFTTALMEILAVQSFETDIFEAIDALMGGFGGLDYPSIEALLARLVEGSPAFLTVERGDGEAVFFSARDHLAAVGQRLNEAAAWMKAAPEDERPQVSAWRGDTLWIQGVPHEDGEARYELELDEALLATLSRASEAFTTPGLRLDFQTEVIPVLSTIIHYAAALGLLDGLSERLPPLAGFPRPFVEQVLKGLLPLPIALDFGTFFTQPTGLRLFLPVIREGHILAEWECLEDLAEGHPSGTLGFLCHEDAPLTDGPHFSGDEAIAADGHLSSAPYLRWSDPTLQGLLWVNAEAYGLGDGWLISDQLYLNLVISDFFSRALSLLP